uniref:lactadherin-like n=1 Tax=Styela clava TaxID=7725 RepID=UPI0019398B98|nr:lactadherin-like [Styela clava]
MFFLDARNKIDNVGPHRPGKRGPAGASGPQGSPGPPGVCDCIPEEVLILQNENKDLKEKVQRIRKTSPETFCLLGMKDGSIPDSSITVSSNSGSKKYSRLDHGSHGWYPNSNNPGHEWIMTDLGKIRPVTGVVTQGRFNADSWTKQFQVEHSRDGFNFTDVKKSDGSEMVFQANSDRTTKVVNRFPKPVKTRFVRIYPMAYHNGMYIRFDVIDC